MGPQDQNCVGELAALVDAAGRARGLEYGRLYRSLYLFFLAAQLQIYGVNYIINLKRLYVYFFLFLLLEIEI